MLLCFGSCPHMLERQYPADELRVGAENIGQAQKLDRSMANMTTETMNKPLCSESVTKSRRVHSTDLATAMAARRAKTLPP